MPLPAAFLTPTNRKIAKSPEHMHRPPATQTPPPPYTRSPEHHVHARMQAHTATRHPPPHTHTRVMFASMPRRGDMQGAAGRERRTESTGNCTGNGGD